MMVATERPAAERRTVGGEQVLRDWVRMSHDYLAERVGQIPDVDPLRGEIVSLATRFAVLAAEVPQPLG